MKQNFFNGIAKERMSFGLNAVCLTNSLGF